MIELVRSSWPEVESYLSSSDGVIVPIGAIEQHGTEGLLGTDAFCAEHVARGACAVVGAALAPTITLGMAQFGLAFPGTISLRPSTLLRVVYDYLRSLQRSGFRRIYIVNGHGGNVAPVRSAIDEFYADESLDASRPGSPVRIVMSNWWDGPRTNRLRQQLYGDDEGFHATPSEMAITAAALGESVRRFATDRAAPQLPSDGLRFAGDHYFDAVDFRLRFPDGRVLSAPHRATRQQGVRLLESAVADVVEDYRAFLQLFE